MQYAVETLLDKLYWLELPLASHINKQGAQFIAKSVPLERLEQIRQLREAIGLLQPSRSIASPLTGLQVEELLKLKQ
ncbi:hypothetical protein SAMN05421823_11941 [Catalinimonas alkaloidigena]|uniref:Uncharacterized protein n=1 Tax=Catalinimonas alkaloidigena TaxID=1075417 RepID=A0A1G9V7H2_9BACT|nr:hypothetical protein [Catalinimonas alkaloidigena]SDM68111.1 hypothetical protein SAMN05421823_11941 [Catalinimonas alkaloidigena]